MAAPTLQEVLAREPQLAGAIDAMNELLPGVPANKGNLATLLGHLKKEGRIDIDTGRDKPHIIIIILVCKHRKQLEILAHLGGPQERWYPGQRTPGYAPTHRGRALPVYRRRPPRRNRMGKARAEEVARRRLPGLPQRRGRTPAQAVESGRHGQALALRHQGGGGGLRA